MLNQEEKRRKLNAIFDTKPGRMHLLNYAIVKPLIKGKKVLDIGCWTGQFTNLIANETKETIGIDPGEKAIRFAKKSITKAIFLVGSMNELPFDNSYFDVITAFDVIEHLQKWTEKHCLKEAYRVLKPGGFLILSTPNKHILSIILDPAFFLISHRHYSMEELTTLLKEANFAIISTLRFGGIAHLLNNNLNLMEKHILKKVIKRPRFLIEQIEKEYTQGGFASNYIIAQKK